ncbi:MAG: hypothetical protein EBW14_19360 [Oxalobacteraceae bacterium]|nr:hypothetical protein [Oxalobacteraceae bacterium]
MKLFGLAIPIKRSDDTAPKWPPRTLLSTALSVSQGARLIIEQEINQRLGKKPIWLIAIGVVLYIRTRHNPEITRFQHTTRGSKIAP